MKESLNSNKPYLIAETAYAFEGDKEYLMKQTHYLSKKINAVKYHMLLNIDEYMYAEHPLYEHAKSWMLLESDWVDILNTAKNKALDTVVLVDDTDSVKFCEKNSDLIDAIEIHAACVNDLNLLDKAIDFAKRNDKVFVIGISGFEIQELFDIVEYLKKSQVRDVLMMYGFQNYPTNVDDIKLTKIPVLKDLLGYKVGYADHTLYSDINKENLILAAYALGANFQEIHYIMEEGVERTDYSAAIGLERIERISEILNTSYRAIGNPDFRLNQGEKEYLNFRKVPIYSKDIKKGEILYKENIVYKRVETPRKQHKFRELEAYFGQALRYDAEKGAEIKIEDFEELE